MSFLDQFALYSMFPSNDYGRLGTLKSSIDNGAYSLSPSLTGPARSGSLLIELDIFKKIVIDSDLPKKLAESILTRIDSLKSQSFISQKELKTLRDENRRLSSDLKMQQTENTNDEVDKSELQTDLNNCKIQLEAVNRELIEKNNAIDTQNQVRISNKLEIDGLTTKINELQRRNLELQSEIQTGTIPTPQEQQNLQQSQEDKKKSEEKTKNRIELDNYNKRRSAREINTKQLINETKNSVNNDKDDPTLRDNAKKLLSATIQKLKNKIDELIKEKIGKSFFVQQKVNEEISVVQEQQSDLEQIKIPEVEKGEIKFDERKDNIIYAWKIFLKEGGKFEVTELQNKIFSKEYTEDKLPDPAFRASTGLKPKDWTDARNFLLPLLEEIEEKMKDNTDEFMKGKYIKTEGRLVLKVVKDFGKTIKTLLTIQKPSPTTIVGRIKRGEVINTIFKMAIALERIFEGVDDPKKSNDTYFADTLWEDIKNLSEELVKELKLDPIIIESIYKLQNDNNTKTLIDNAQDELDIN